MTGGIAPAPQLFYASTLGMLATVNPCGFPLLPAYLELFTGRRGARDAGSPGGERRLARAGAIGGALTAGLFSTLGFMAVFGLLGVVVELGWSAVAGNAVTVARYVMVGLGAAMVVAGAAWVLHRPVRLRVPALPVRWGRRRPVALVAFGASYAVASLGCALPLFVSGVATTFTRTDALSGTADFLSYALGMGIMLAALALVVALAGPAAARPLRPLSRFVPALGSVLLLVVGLYLVSYWLSAIVAPTSAVPVEGLVARAQEAVSSFVNAHAEAIEAVTGAVIVGALLAAGLFGYRAAPQPALPTSPEPSRP